MALTAGRRGDLEKQRKYLMCTNCLCHIHISTVTHLKLREIRLDGAIRMMQGLSLYVGGVKRSLLWDGKGGRS